MFKLTFVLLFVFALGVQGEKVKEFQDEVDGHEGQCKGKDNKFYKLGETMKDEPCARKICRGSAQPGAVYIEVEKCSTVQEQPGCELKKDAKKNFPECCARLECKHH